MPQNLPHVPASRSFNHRAERKNGNHVNAYDSTDPTEWSSYAKFRPPYPAALFDRIYSHHASHGGRFDVAHDAGCGPGITAAILSRRFKHVVCSDFSAQAIETARRRLTGTNHVTSEKKPGATFEFRQSGAEDMSWIPAASVDMVTMSECLHWTDTSKTTAAVARVLKPGGTFAVWYYSDLLLPDNKGAQAIYDEIMNGWLKLRSEWSEESERTLWIENTGYDCVGFPEEQGWIEGVRRIKFNTGGDNGVFKRDKERGWMMKESQVRPGEVLEYVEHAKEWELEADVPWLRGWFRSLMPKIEATGLEKQLVKLGEALRAHGGKTRAVWPVVLILATKAAAADRESVNHFPKLAHGEKLLKLEKGN